MKRHFAIPKVDPPLDILEGAEPVPSPGGMELMKRGHFGSVGVPLIPTHGNSALTEALPML